MLRASKPTQEITVRHSETRGWIIEIKVAFRDRPAILVAETHEDALAIAQHLRNVKFKI